MEILIIVGIVVAVIIALLISAYSMASFLFKTALMRQKTHNQNTGSFAKHMEVINAHKENIKNAGCEDVWITNDGLKLHGYLKKTTSNIYIISVHGWHGEAIQDSALINPFLLKTNYNVLYIDLRAHGKSEGDYVGFGVLDHLDLLKWIDYLNTRFSSEIKIILHGISMGANTVLLTADKVPLTVKGIIADSGFTSVWECFSYICRMRKIVKYPVLPFMQSICKKKAGYTFKQVSTLNTVDKAKVPILFIHGKEDTFVNPEFTKEAYNACTSEKDLVLFDESKHGTCYLDHKDEYKSKVMKFIEKKTK